MEVLDCITSRRSIRKYLDKPVPWDIVSNILEAGRFAPSSGNLQNWKFIVVLDEDKRKAIAEAALKQLWMLKAPVHIVICAEPEKAKRYYGDRGERLYTVQNCAAAMQNMLLEAHNLGLGACWVGAFDEDMVKRALGMPKEARPEAIITLGYPDEEVPVPAKFPLETVMYFNKWRGKIKDVPAYFMYYSPGIKKNVLKGKATLEKASKKAAEKAKEVAKKIRKRIEEKKKQKRDLDQFR